jgi:hypothetical protein
VLRLANACADAIKSSASSTNEVDEFVAQVGDWLSILVSSFASVHARARSPSLALLQQSKAMQASS